MSLSRLKDTLERIYASRLPQTQDLESALLASRPEEKKLIFDFADRTRKEFVGNGVLLRGIIEFSNFCGNSCFYCGLNKGNGRLKRYRMSEEELLENIGHLARANIRTVVLQSGEDGELDAEWLAVIVSEIKSKFDIAVTLSLGERTQGDYRLWKEAGADRYLLKIETSSRRLYESMHPGMSFERRLDCLRVLRRLGYQVGSGDIIGLKGQSLKDIAEDIRFFKENDFDMIGIGPFIAHAETEFRGQANGSLNISLKALALTRIVTRDAHLPATTALGSLGADYRWEALKAGANVLMPDFTPQPYRRLYEIYPGRRCADEAAGSCPACMETMVKSLGRFIDYAKGDSLKSRSVPFRRKDGNDV